MDDEEDGGEGELDLEQIEEEVNPISLNKPGKINVVHGQSAAFNATDRANRAHQLKHYGDGSSVGPIFFPNFSIIQKRYGSNVKILNPNSITNPR